MNESSGQASVHGCFQHHRKSAELITGCVVLLLIVAAATFQKVMACVVGELPTVNVTWDAQRK